MSTINQTSSMKAVAMITESGGLNNVICFPNQIESTKYICDFKKNSVEFDLLRDKYHYIRTGKVVQYLCFLFRLHSFPVNGFPWAVFKPTKVGGKTIASHVDVKTEKTIYAMLNEIRTSYSFSKGFKQDPEEIDFKGMLFASFHQASKHETRWYMNYPAINALADSIMKEASSLKVSSPFLKVKTDNLKVSPSIALVTTSPETSPITSPETSPKTSPITSPTTSPLLLDVYLGVGVEVEVGETAENKNPSDTTPTGFQPQNSAGKTKYQVGTIPTTKIPVPKRTGSTLYGVWKDCAETIFKVKGLSSDLGKDDLIAVRNLRSKFEKEPVAYPVEEMVAAVMENWTAVKTMLVEKHDKWQLKKKEYPSLGDIYYSFSPIFTWYEETKAEIETKQKIAVLAKDNKAKQDAHSKTISTPKPINAKSSVGYTYIGQGFKYSNNGSVNRTFEEDYVEYLSCPELAGQAGMIMDILKLKAVDLAASLARIEQLKSESKNV